MKVNSSPQECQPYVHQLGESYCKAGVLCLSYVQWMVPLRFSPQQMSTPSAAVCVNSCQANRLPYLAKPPPEKSSDAYGDDGREGHEGKWQQHRQQCKTSKAGQPGVRCEHVERRHAAHRSLRHQQTAQGTGSLSPFSHPATYESSTTCISGTGAEDSQDHSSRAVMLAMTRVARDCGRRGSYLIL